MRPPLVLGLRPVRPKVLLFGPRAVGGDGEASSVLAEVGAGGWDGRDAVTTGGAMSGIAIGRVGVFGTRGD